MFIEILKRTPPWVFGLFFLLLGVGLLQCKARVVPLGRAMALPLAMILLSAYGVFSAFQTSAIGLVAWLAAVLFAVYLNRLLGYQRGVIFNSTTRSFFIPGSRVPLALMMAIYFTKYGVAVALARNAALSTVPAFIASVSSAYGFFSGLFFAAAVGIWQKKRRGVVF